MTRLALPVLLLAAFASAAAAAPRRFERIWATSMEPQRITGRSDRGDRYVNTFDHGCALPDRAALHRIVRVENRATGKSVLLPVVDVGPWNTEDPYWETDHGRPAAERRGVDSRGRRTNGAGIDLSFGAWISLGVPRARVLTGKHSGWVDWEFVPDARRPPPAR